jgi:hypothetical protein
LAAFGAGVFLALALGASDADLDRWTGATVTLATPEGLAVMLATQVLSLAIVWLAAGRDGRRGEVLRLGVPQPGWGVSLLAGAIVVAATGALELFMAKGLGLDLFADTKWLAEGLRSELWWGTALIAIVLAPIWEELTFRGFLLSALARTRLGYWPGAVISSGLWTLLHWGYSYPGLVSVFAAGLVLSWLMWRWGSMRAVVVAHGFANAVALVFAYIFAPA